MRDGECERETSKKLTGEDTKRDTEREREGQRLVYNADEDS